MDYDGSNQRQLTHQDSISLSPRISPDGSRLAFSSLTKGGWDILMFSMDLNRVGQLSALRRHQSFARLVARRRAPRALVLARRPFRNLYLRCFRRQSSCHDHGAGAGGFSRVESQDRSANRFRQRQHRIATGLHHGSRRHQPAAHDRPRLCCLAELVAQRTVLDAGMEAQVRPRRARLLRHLPDGYCQQTMGAADSRWRDATIFHRGRPTAATSFFSPAAPARRKSG